MMMTLFQFSQLSYRTFSGAATEEIQHEQDIFG